jgi:hypothetical protein
MANTAFVPYIILDTVDNLLNILFKVGSYIFLHFTKMTKICAGHRELEMLTVSLYGYL